VQASPANLNIPEGLCPRADTHLTYMIDIALTTEFVLDGGPR
jgi:hypothetical protein